MLRLYLAGRDAPCPACGYNLRDGGGTECPECGAALGLEATLGAVRTVIAGDPWPFYIAGLVPIHTALWMHVLAIIGVLVGLAVDRFYYGAMSLGAVGAALAMRVAFAGVAYLMLRVWQRAAPWLVRMPGPARWAAVLACAVLALCPTLFWPRLFTLLRSAME